MTTNIKPPADLFDLSKLSESSLRKYQVTFYFNKRVISVLIAMIKI